MTDGDNESINHLPESWSAVRLGDVAKPRGGFGFPISKQGKKDGEFPFFKVSDMNLPGNERFMRASNNWIDSCTLRELRAKTFPRSAIIFPKIGAALLTNKKRMLTRDSIVDNNVMAVVVNDEHECVPEYLYQWFLTLDLGRVANPGTVPSLTASRLEEVTLPLPPPDEQRKIAAVLGLVQRAIEQQERLIALTTELKKTLLHKLFTEGLRGEPQKQTEVGPMPESWDVVSLASLFEIKHGYAFAGEFFVAQGRYVLLTPGHFFEEGGFRDQKDKTKYYVGEIPRSYLLAKGDLLVAMTEQKAGLLGSAIIVPESEKFLHNQRLGLIQNLDEQRLDKLFLYYFFNTVAVRNQIFLTSSGSKVRHTSPGKIRELNIALPCLDEQGDIVQILRAVDAKLEVSERKRETMTDLFCTLLHQLMTAQIRVHDIDMPLNPHSQ